MQEAFNLARRQIEDYIRKQPEERRKILEKWNMPTVVKRVCEDRYGFSKTTDSSGDYHEK